MTEVDSHADFQWGRDMKRLIAPTQAIAGAAILSAACICAPALAATPYTKVWTQQLGTTAHDRAEALAADGNGHVYLSGYTGNALVPPHSGGWDMFLTQYDTSGAEQWTDQQGTSTHDLGHGLIADADGNASLIGYTSAALGGPHIGGVDALIYRYDVAGNIEWSDQFGTTVEDAARGVTLDAAGNIYVTGYTHGSLGANNVGGEDAFLRKYDPNGNPLWTAQIGSAANERSTGVAIDGLGNIYIGGRTQGQIGAAHAGGWDAFLARFDTAGNHIWTQQFGTTADDMGYRIAADSADHIYVTGTTAGVLGAENAGGFDAFLRQFDPSGSEQWTVQFGTPDYDSGFGISTDALGRVYVTGDTEGALAGSNAGGMDVFLTRYDAAGAEHWLTQFGSAGHDNSRLASVYPAFPR